ncbi:MAG: phage tail protein [Actinomycetota bacterium]|nr:phage tail protein [Actinomycetota bacterium]
MTSRDASGWLVEQLPRTLAEDHFMQRFLLVFENISDSIRDRIRDFHHYLDVGVGPVEFVRWMAAWLDVPIDASLPEERQRGFVSRAGTLLYLRGTRAGLQGLIEALTGSDVKIDDGGGVWPEGSAPDRQARVKVTVKNSGGVNEQQLFELVRRELPANTPFDLTVGRRRVREAAEAPQEEEEGQEGMQVMRAVKKPPDEQDKG